MSQVRKGPLRGPFFLAGAIFGKLSGIALCLGAQTALAEQLYDVVLDNGDDVLNIATLSVTALDEDDGYTLNFSEALFGDYFLSMRPFRCITHSDKMLCHLPYPYENRRRLGRDALTDLEYDLLFIARSPTEYGINPWNGRYFHLRWEGEAIHGQLHETDLDILAAPPEGDNLRPLADVDMVPMARSDGQWVPDLRILPRQP
ncbi:MAG: hypothetical protein AAGL66_14750 [Pseudomonadota bacterium]